MSWGQAGCLGDLAGAAAVVPCPFLPRFGEKRATFKCQSTVAVHSGLFLFKADTAYGSFSHIRNLDCTPKVLLPSM